MSFTVPVGSWRECESDYRLSHHLITFLTNNCFYARLSRSVQKRMTLDIPTAAVTFDPKQDELVMWVNPEFMKRLGHQAVQGILMHEFNHIVFGHLNDRRKADHDTWGMASDLANNSLIVRMYMDDASKASRYASSGNCSDRVDFSAVDAPLPRGALVPGYRPWVDPAVLASMPEERAKLIDELASSIASMPQMKTSEWYYEQLLPLTRHRNEQPVLATADVHDGWQEISPEMQEYVSVKVRCLVEQATRYADSQGRGWGSIPAEICSEIRRSVSRTVDWRSVLRWFTGTIIRGRRRTSMKRINRRYPYVYPGAVRGHKAKLIVAIDESGSVSDTMVGQFFSELELLTKKVDVSILHFDSDCSEADVYEWKKGTRPKLDRARRGGTDFDAPTRFVNDPMNRNRWDGFLIMTDGCAPKPIPSRIKRGWVLGSGCKLMFDIQEAQIVLGDDVINVGAWR